MTDAIPLEADDSGHYWKVVGEADSFVASLGPALRAVAAPFLAELAGGGFTRVVVLLPFWLSEILPLTIRQLEGLATAHLYGWWYYAAQDRVLDQEGEPELMLAGHLALVRMMETYRDLGLHETPCWSELMALTLTSAESYAEECASHFDALSELSPQRLAPWTRDLVVKRAACFYFNTIAQLQLAGQEPRGLLGRELICALQSFTVARQLADDASDWHADLVAGHLNMVSARLMRRMYERGLAVSGEDLDIERLLGHQVSDEPFWTTVEHDCQRAADDALATFEALGAYRLSGLLRRQRQEHDALWSALRAGRTSVRAIFGVEPHLR